MVSLTSLLSVLAAGMVLLVTVRVYSIIVNYLTARHFGLPIVITPFSWQDAFWIFARPLLPWIRGLPFGLGSWDRYSYFGWSLNDRFAMHKRLGDAFIIVSAGRNEIYIAAPETATEIVTRYRIWHKMIDVYDVFTIFGQNVMTVNGNDWQRHRKITGTAFREQNNRIVWDESLKQAGGLMSTWLRNGERTLKHLAADAMVLSMHVLSAAGFGKSYEFQNGVRKVEPGHSMSYAEATTTLLTNLVNFFIVEQLKIPAWLRTSNLRKTKQAASEFKQYMTESVAKERERLHQEHAVAGDELLSAIVHANEVAKKEEKRNSDPTKALGDEEMYGNVFIFNAAGYDTTASAISYTVPLLAANHDVQEWCGQELEALIPTGFASEVPYCETFPKLVRCCAVMVS